MASLNGLDIGILALTFISALIGIYRGFLRETLTLVTWIIASIIAVMYGNEAATLFNFVDAPSTRKLLGIAAVFILVVLFGFLIKFIVCKAFSVQGPSPLDRALGGVFGFVRATVITVLVILGVPSTVLQQSWYKGSQLIPKFNSAANTIRNQTPKEWKEAIDKGFEEYFPETPEKIKQTAASAVAEPESTVAPAEHTDTNSAPSTPPKPSESSEPAATATEHGN